jgi:predicted HNH restriction endonuclease
MNWYLGNGTAGTHNRIHAKGRHVCATRGKRGAGFIEVHHLRPVSRLERKTIIDPRKDMTVVCSNCHRMIHRRKDNVLSPKSLKLILHLQGA